MDSTHKRLLLDIVWLFLFKFYLCLNFFIKGNYNTGNFPRPRRVSGFFCLSTYISQLGLLDILIEIRKWLSCSHNSDRQAVVFKSLETCTNKDESTSRHLKPVHASSRCTCYKRLNLSRHRYMRDNWVLSFVDKSLSETSGLSSWEEDRGRPTRGKK